MSTIKKIAKNNLVLFSAQIINIILSIILVILLARFLLPIGYGKYSFALSFTAIFAIFMDMGLNTLLTREIARKKEKLKEYFNNFFAIKVFFSFIVMIAMIIIINLMPYPIDTKLAVCIIGMSVVIGSFSDMIVSVFRAFEKMEYEALGNILERVIIVSIALIALFSGYGLIAVTLIFLFAAVMRFLLFYSIYSKKFAEFRIKLEFNTNLWKNLLKKSIPFALAGIFTMLYLKIDTIMISMMRGDAAVGWYNAAYGIVLAISFVPGVFLTSIFPVLSNYFISLKEVFRKIYVLSFRYLLILALPMAIGMSLLSEKIILLFFSAEYLPSINILRILALIQIFAFLGWLSGVALNSINKQKLFAYSTGAGVFVNILLNFFLIPRFGLYGAAIATLITQIIVFAFLFNFSSKYCCKIKAGKMLIKPLIAVIIMSLAVIMVQKSGLIISIPVGAIAYFASLYFLKGFSKEDKMILLKIFKPDEQKNQENDLINALNKELKDCHSILDIGCGKSSSLQHIGGKHYSVGVDLFGPYLKESRKAKIHNRYIKADITKINFKKNSFDAVIAIDVLEHLTKNEGFRLIRKMEKWARGKNIIFTPNGFIVQHEYDKNKLQLHKSGWIIDELKNLGFKIYGINGWKFLRGYKARIRFRPFPLWNKISQISQKIAYNHPKYAFQLFCVKYKNEA